MTERNGLILTNYQSPGDILVLTAAVRDLRHAMPKDLQIDVRTSVPALWSGNPHLAALSEEAEGVQVIACEYPLIHSSNSNGRHFISAFHDFIGDRLGLRLELGAFRGEVFLSEYEQSPTLLETWGIRRSRPLWIVNAGGKFDFTAKWWPTDYYQRVIDELRGEVDFIQVGTLDHYHPPLAGVCDLRGRTSLRELISLIYWSSGVLCPVTFVMHLAAAVPRNLAVRDGLRPCIVVAGGREPVSWEAYPGHQYLHTIGMLDCCAHGACWRSRTVPIFDGRDEDHSFCLRPRGGFPECMRMIEPDRVVAAIRGYELEGAFACPPPPEAR